MHSRPLIFHSRYDINISFKLASSTSNLVILLNLGKNLYDYFSSKLDRNIFMYALIIPIHLNIITTIVPEKTPNIIPPITSDK